MKNTILKFEERKGIIDGKEYVVPDYFSKNIDVKSFFEEMPEHEEYSQGYLVQNNDKLERIQFEHYDNQDYWDIIQLINGIDPLVGMPVDDEYIFDAAEQYQDNLLEDRFQKITDEGILEELREQFIERFFEESQKHKNIILVPPNRMPKLISILKQEGFI